MIDVYYLPKSKNHHYCNSYLGQGHCLDVHYRQDWMLKNMAHLRCTT